VPTYKSQELFQEWQAQGTNTSGPTGATLQTSVLGHPQKEALQVTDCGKQNFDEKPIF
jgi:hypothetical protein